MRRQLAVGAVVVAAAGLFVVLAAGAAWAHHAFSAEFDANQPGKFDKATVTRMEWTNPHVWIFVDVEQEDGTGEPWAIEAGTPNVLFRRGFTKDSLAPGTTITVDGYRVKDGSKRANGRDILLPDGRTLFVGSSGTGAPYELRQQGDREGWTCAWPVPVDFSSAHTVNKESLPLTLGGTAPMRSLGHGRAPN